mgnify:CR=1 FL=1
MELECTEVVKRLGKWPVGNQPLYQLLAEGLKKAILEGDIPLASRLPPERAFAAALAVSRSTVVAAYALLREEGWLESRQGSGTKVLMPPIPSARTLETVYNPSTADRPITEQMFDKPDNLIDFSAGIPAALDLARLGQTHYDISLIMAEKHYLAQGWPVLRRALAQLYTRQGIPTNEDQILITNGAQQAIALLAALYLQPGDMVLLENPTYFGAMDAFRQVGARLNGIPVDLTTGIRLDLLQTALSGMRPRFLYLTPTFQNPTGAVMPVEHRKKLVQLAEQNDLVVVEDNTLSDLELDQAAPPPLAAFSQDDKVITVGSMSKLFWTGLRIGWVRATPAIITRLARLKVVNDLGAGMVNQALAARWLENYAQAKEWRKQELLPRRDQTIRLLQEHLPEWEYNRPGGGIFLWVKLAGVNAGAFAQLAMRYGVILLPGNMMSVDESYSQYIRLPFLHDHAHIQDGISRLSRAWQAHCLLNKNDASTVNFIV